MLNKMYKSEIAWVAGILEGEGSFISSRKKSKLDTEYYGHRIQCNMTDGDIIERLHKLTGIGRMHGPKFHKNPKYKPYFIFLVHKYRDVYALCKTIYSYMGIRRKQQIDKIFDLMDKFPMIQITRHGTRHSYEKGCRCRLCKNANNKRMNQRRRRMGIPERQDAKHGSRSMYVRHRCRCKLCILANRLYQRQNYHSSEEDKLGGGQC